MPPIAGIAWRLPRIPRVLPTDLPDPSHDAATLRAHMIAWLCRRYGGPDAVELVEVPTPVPGPGEILIEIQATTVTAGDWRVRTLRMPRGFGPIARLALGFRRPRQPILGTELAGTVAAVGAGVTRYGPGDAVFAFPGAKMGCHAQYRTMPETGAVAPKPGHLSFEEAASLPFGAMTAIHFLRKAGVKAGDRILVIGASGSVGSALVQLARHLGAIVTGVTSTRNLALVASLGASQVIDYTQEDVTTRRNAYDVVAECVGATPAARLRPTLAPGGRLLAIAGGLPELLATLWSPLTARRVIAGPAAERPEDFQEVASLARSGALKPLIDRRYPFARMREAHAYVETGRKRGSVVVTVEHPG